MWFVPHHDAHARLLTVQAGPVLGSETTRDAIAAGAVELRGWWVDPEDEALVLLATPDGPTLFQGGRSVVLEQGGWSATSAPIDEGRRLFQLQVGGDPWLTVEYETPPSQTGPFVDDEVADFYRWLVGKVDRDAFYRFWTADWPT